MTDLWKNRNWKPMLLKEVDEPFDSLDYIYEMKFDGIRALAFVSPNEVKLYSRKNIDITFLYPELINLCKVVKRKTIFDGEIVDMENGVPSFSSLQKRVHLKSKSKINRLSKINPVVFVSFDLLYDNGNIIDYPLKERKKMLNKYTDNDYFIKTKYVETNGIKLFNSIKKLNLEGIVAKKKESRYEPNTRTFNWLKIKNLSEGTFFIGGYIEKPDNYVVSLLLGELNNNKLEYVGKVTLGKQTLLYSKVIDETPMAKSPFVNFEDDKVTYINPKIVCEVKFLERTLNNQLRHPVIKNCNK